MAQDWLLETLGDLRDFARRNGLPQLAEQMSAAILVAEAELATRRPPAGQRPS